MWFGLRVGAAWRCSTFTRWTEWTLAMTWSWWQHYKYRPGYYYYYYYSTTPTLTAAARCTLSLLQLLRLLTATARCTLSLLHLQCRSPHRANNCKNNQQMNTTQQAVCYLSAGADSVDSCLNGAGATVVTVDEKRLAGDAFSRSHAARISSKFSYFNAWTSCRRYSSSSWWINRHDDGDTSSHTWL